MDAKKIAAFAVGPVGAAALGFITLPIVTWFYSVEDVGRIAMLQVASSFCVLLFGLGLDQAYIREYHESEFKPALLKSALLPGFMILFAVLCFLLMFSGFISKLLFSIDSVAMSAIVALCMLAAFISRFLSLVLRMQEKGLAFSMGQLLPKLLFLIVIGIYVLFEMGFDFYFLVLAHAFSIVFVALLYAWNTRNEWIEGLQQHIDKSSLLQMLRFGAPLIVGGVAFWGLTAIDRVFLRSISSYDELGVYSVSVSFAVAATILQSVFSTIWAPTVYKWASTGTKMDKIDRVTQYILLIVLVLFCLAGVFSWLIDFILPENYTNVKYIIVSCLGYPLLYTLSETTAVGINITKKTIYSMVATVIAFIFNVIGNLLLIPKYGAAGAAVSTMLAFLVFFILRTEISNKLWRPIARVRLYLFVFIVMFMASITTLFGDKMGMYLYLIWSLLLLVVLFSFKKEVIDAISWLGVQKSKNNNIHTSY